MQFEARKTGSGKRMMSADSNTFSSSDCKFLEWAEQVSKGNNPFGNASEEKIKETHALAFFLYREQHYQDASHFFRMLVAARPSEAKFWKGLGACLQMLKEYEEALNCYASAQMLNGEKTDPYLYLHAADCYIALKSVDSAFKALESASLRAKKLKDKRVLGHVKLMRELWSK